MYFGPRVNTRSTVSRGEKLALNNGQSRQQRPSEVVDGSTGGIIKIEVSFKIRIALSIHPITLSSGGKGWKHVSLT